jgi:rhodanese-related sulfurtransferase
MPTVIDRSQLQRMLRDGAQLLDVLAAGEFANEHIPGALNVPLAELRADSTTHLDGDRPIIAYCYDRE